MIRIMTMMISVDSQMLNMVAYGTELLIVDDVDRIWQTYGIAQDVDKLLTFSC
jgi:hypothetical protein